MKYTSIIFFDQFKRFNGPQSSAESIAKYELKLFKRRKCYISKK